MIKNRASSFQNAIRMLTRLLQNGFHHNEIKFPKSLQSGYLLQGQKKFSKDAFRIGSVKELDEMSSNEYIDLKQLFCALNKHAIESKRLHRHVIFFMCLFCTR